MDCNIPVVIWMRGLTLIVIFLIVLPSARLHLTGVKVGALQGDVHRLTNLIRGDWVIFQVAGGVYSRKDPRLTLKKTLPSRSGLENLTRSTLT